MPFTFMPRFKNTTDREIQSPEDIESVLPLKKRRMKKREIALLVLVIVAVLGVAGTVYFYTQYVTLEKNPNAVQQAQVTALVKQVGQLMLLPNETPTVATVEDVKALSSQPFFVNAANGDKVLVFVNARQAILYRPSQNKIINVAPLYFQNNQATPEEQAAVSSGPAVSTKSSKSSTSSSTAQ
jgi:hypothetical protein